MNVRIPLLLVVAACRMPLDPEAVEPTLPLPDCEDPQERMLQRVVVSVGGDIGTDLVLTEEYEGKLSGTVFYDSLGRYVLIGGKAFGFATGEWQSLDPSQSRYCPYVPEARHPYDDSASAHEAELAQMEELIAAGWLDEDHPDIVYAREHGLWHTLPIVEETEEQPERGAALIPLPIGGALYIAMESIDADLNLDVKLWQVDGDCNLGDTHTACNSKLAATGTLRSGFEDPRK